MNLTPQQRAALNYSERRRREREKQQAQRNATQAALALIPRVASPPDEQKDEKDLTE